YKYVNQKITKIYLSNIRGIRALVSFCESKAGVSSTSFVRIKIFLYFCGVKIPKIINLQISYSDL
ncbi:MAG: hypothetical protein NC328_05800, partial [Muribaculum sp.]|nr:hypothetical protein [Muribaculum sp.]